MFYRIFPRNNQPTVIDAPSPEAAMAQFVANCGFPATFDIGRYFKAIVATTEEIQDAGYIVIPEEAM